MAAFASCRRSGAVRVMVLLLCALFIFATLGAPAAQALGVESVAVFGLASVLSAATAALGFKLASNEQGQATLQKMVQDFKTVAWATGFVLVGSKLNGLQNGMDYIKMQVKNGKTYLDSRVFAWVQQWLAQNGVYNSTQYVNPSFSDGDKYKPVVSMSQDQVLNLLDSNDASIFSNVISHFNLDLKDKIFELMRVYVNGKYRWEVMIFNDSIMNNSYSVQSLVSSGVNYFYIGPFSVYTYYYDGSSFLYTTTSTYLHLGYFSFDNSPYNPTIGCSNSVVVSSSSNDTGLSGTDTLGKDVVDLTLDQILERLKEWSQDWFDAGADSATNAATGAQDLPLTVATGAATANPSIAEDGPLVWFPSFGLPIPSLRTGETDTNTVDQGKENANTADKTEAAAGTVEETQTIVDSLLNWASDYISPDKGLFSKFPLCIPYDAYLLVCSALGVDALGVDDVVGSSPGDVQSVMGSGVEVYSNFNPVINFKHELKAGGTTYPIAFTLDLSPFEPIVKLNRIFVTVYVLAELIASEYKRIRSS